jgi:hypothetical protein
LKSGTKGKLESGDRMKSDIWIKNKAKNHTQSTVNMSDLKASYRKTIVGDKIFPNKGKKTQQEIPKT